MCMHALDDDTMLVGTLSHFVNAYSTKSRRLLWSIRLNDSVLSLASYDDEGLKHVYAGLADGTVAVIEPFDGRPDSFYIPIGSNPVTCLQLVECRLWCGIGNRIVILNARTLDCVDDFPTSARCLEYVSLLGVEDRGVWITVRGSSILQLWDHHSLTCRLLFDVRDNKYPTATKEEDACIGRITALLPVCGSVWIGTAEGCLLIYDVHTQKTDSGCYSTPVAENICVQQTKGALTSLLEALSSHDTVAERVPSEELASEVETSDSYEFDDVFVTYTEDESLPETSETASIASADVPYAFELRLQEKIKIADKPIKCLLQTRCGSEPIIISCAGCYGDDETVLKWTRVRNEELWTNDPIVEVCPYTNTMRPSPYARCRLPTGRTPNGSQ